MQNPLLERVLHFKCPGVNSNQQAQDDFFREKIMPIYFVIQSAFVSLTSRIICTILNYYQNGNENI
jgi:hypothetical protein